MLFRSYWAISDTGIGIATNLGNDTFGTIVD